jgi:NAD-dependent deacetylase
MDNNILRLANLISESKTITFLTGAGISTSSGIPDFQSTDNDWNHAIPRVQAISKGFFERDPKQFWSIFKDVFQTKLLGNYQPNYGHTFIKELENKGKEITVFTQNVDGLHAQAGSNVFELHGSIHKATCPKCKTEYDLDYINKELVPRCYCKDNKFILKPNVVLFGDIVKHIKQAEEVLDRTNLFIVVGSSLEVYPVNNIPMYAKLGGETHLAIINKTPTKMDEEFHIVIHNDIIDTFKQIKNII